MRIRSSASVPQARGRALALCSTAYACSAVMVRVPSRDARRALRVHVGVGHRADRIEMPGIGDEHHGVSAPDWRSWHHQRQHQSRLHVGRVERCVVDSHHIWHERPGRGRGRISRFRKPRSDHAPRHGDGERRAGIDRPGSGALSLQPLAAYRVRRVRWRRSVAPRGYARGLHMDRDQSVGLESRSPAGRRATAPARSRWPCRPTPERHAAAP